MSRLQRFQHIVRVGAILLFLLSLSSAHSQRMKSTVDYKPFTKDGLPLVRLKVNDSVLGNFVVDTGSSHTLISTDMASRLHATVHPLMADNGQPVQLGDKQALGVDATIMFGGYKMAGPVIVVPTKSLQAMRSVRIDGLIGHSFLSHAAFLFDFKREQITVWYPGGLTDAEVQLLKMKEPVVVEQSKPTDFVFSVPVVLNGSTRLNMIVDTGGGATNIPVKVAQEMNLEPTERGIRSTTIFGPLVTSKAIMSNIKVGSLTLINTPVEYADREYALVPPRIGMDILHLFLVLIDYPAKKVYFATPGIFNADLLTAPPPQKPDNGVPSRK